MSITIKVEDFQDWSSIFGEINRQQNLKVFTAIAPDTTHATSQSRKPKGSQSMEPGRTSHDKPRCQATEYKAVSLEQSFVQPLSRRTSTPRIPITPIDIKKAERDYRLTDAARNLTKEQMASLYEDILKPLDVTPFCGKNRSKCKLIEELFQ